MPSAEQRLSVRQATLDDLDVVVELRIALLREHGSNPVYSRLRPDAAERARPMFAQQLQSRDEAIYLAERDGHALGILRCVDAVGSPLLYPARYGYVSSVYVIPSARRGGVLRAMMESAVRWCESRGLREMRLHNASDNALAAGAWEAMGFEVVEHLRVRSL